MKRERSLRYWLKQGFTLVELIVVIAILGVLAVIMAPQYIKYVEGARKVSCEVELANLQKAIILELAGTGLDDKSAMPQFWQSSLQNLVSTNATSCCSDGRISVIVEEGSVYPSLQCNLDGSGSTPIIVGSHLDKLYETLNTMDKTQGFGSVWETYWASRLQGGASIDSGAGWDNSYAQQMTEYILTTSGMDLTEGSWRIYRLEKDSNQMFNIFWTEEDISELSVGTTVNATRYDAVNKEYLHGTMMVVSNTVGSNTYHVLKGDSFVATP